MRKINISLIVVLVLLISIIIFLGYHFGRSRRVAVQGYIECTSLRMASKIAGRIDKVFVEEGDSVSKGDTLYIISTPELDAKLQQVEAMLSGAKAMDAKAKAGTRKPIIHSAHDMWQKAKVAVTLAQKSYARVQRLYEEGVVSAQKRDEVYASLEAARATERAAKSQYLLAVEGASREDKAAAAAQVKQAKSGVEEVERYLADRVVYAPTDGIVETIVANAGEIVGSGYPVVTITENQTAKAVFNIPENLLPQIVCGKHFNAEVPALGKRVEFEVSYISVEANYATQSATSARGDFDIRTFEVKMNPLDTEPLRAGMSVIIELQKPKER
ncbi:MAG: efflux RND transporter periplasmic adaptor subunit [Alistipes sp.]|nr:efflux RND transporter periplasmic adaptor subunit [Alistipes sp.]